MYFKNFPFIQYPTKDRQTELARDITIRLGFSDAAKQTNELFSEYIVEEGQTPEKIAQEVYGDPMYYWVVLLFNDTQDPQYNMPLRTRSLDEFINRKYPSKTLFLSPVGMTQQFFSHPLGATSTVKNFSEGDTITIYVSKNNYKDTGDDKVLGVIKRFIPELSAIELETLQGVINVGDIISRGYNGEIRAQVTKILDSKFCVHHFEDNGNRINPIATPPDSNGNQVPLGQTGDGFSTNNVGTTQTVLENYINDGFDDYVITNESYEFKQNTQYRRIKLLDPRYLENISRELREVLKQ